MPSSKKSGSQRGGTGGRKGSGGRKTTARAGGSKSPRSRAVSHRAKSETAGRAGASAGRSRTTAKTAPRRRVSRGPGDIGIENKQS